MKMHITLNGSDAGTIDLSALYGALNGALDTGNPDLETLQGARDVIEALVLNTKEYEIEEEPEDLSPTRDGISPTISRADLTTVKEYVMQFLSFNAEHDEILGRDAKEYIYENLADGFGEGEAPDWYDWSHIRDSSPRGYRLMATYIDNAAFQICREDLRFSRFAN